MLTQNLSSRVIEHKTQELIGGTPPINSWVYNNSDHNELQEFFESVAKQRFQKNAWFGFERKAL